MIDYICTEQHISCTEKQKVQESISHAFLHFLSDQPGQQDSNLQLSRIAYMENIQIYETLYKISSETFYTLVITTLENCSAALPFELCPDKYKL